MLTEADMRRLSAELDYFENRARHYAREARAAWPIRLGNFLTDTYRAIPSGRAWQSLGTGLSIAIRRCRGAIAIAVDTDLFFIVTGALIAADLCLCIYFAGGGK